MSRVFVDTSAYFAYINARDDQHASALRLVHQLAQTRDDLFTSNFILAETHALLLRKLGRDIAERFLEEMDISGTRIIRVAARDEARAREIIAHYRDKDFSYTDATSFASMDRLRIQWAFTFDAHFAQYGFEVLG